MARGGFLAGLFVALTGAGCQPPAQNQTPGPTPQLKAPAAIKVSADPWVLSADSWDADYHGLYLGNGRLGQRLMQTGTGISTVGSEPAFMAGNYVHEALATLPPVLPLQVRVNSELFGKDPKKIKKYHQELRLKDGILVTRATWDGGSGDVELEIEAALLRQQPEMALLRAKVVNRGKAPLVAEVPKDTYQAGSTPGSFHYRGNGVAYGGKIQSLEGSPTPLNAPEIGLQIAPGQTASIAVGTWVFREETESKAEPELSVPLDAAGVTDLLAKHRAAWAEQWTRDIEIEGDPEAQQVVRTCLFYLWSSIRPESEAGVPPLGLSSAGFSGHVFWDMDSWMVPALLPQNPDLARAMLDYRVATLPGARANAKAEGLPGASYAWESAATGKETMTTGEFSHGRHVTGDVALAMKQYYTATGDIGWLASKAWPVLQATAENWAARAKPDDKGGYTIPKVTTPDENAGLVEHSAWTHFVARTNLQFGAKTADMIGKAHSEKWDQVAKGLGYLRDKNGLILPYEGFTERSKAKQADVLLLLFPGEAPIKDVDASKMYDFYAQRVIPNGPAMTDAIHAIVAARLGSNVEAYNRFRASYQPFVRPPYEMFSEKRSKDNTCFLTGAAGVVEAVLYGFGGLHIAPNEKYSDQPLLTPRLPANWTTLRIRHLQWRGEKWDVELHPNAEPKLTPAASSPGPGSQPSGKA